MAISWQAADRIWRLGRKWGWWSRWEIPDTLSEPQPFRYLGFLLFSLLFHSTYRHQICHEKHYGWWSKRTPKQTKKVGYDYIRMNRKLATERTAWSAPAPEGVRSMPDLQHDDLLFRLTPWLATLLWVWWIRHLVCGWKCGGNVQVRK